MSEVTGHPSVKKTKLLLEWPPTIELEMRKTPNYLQLTCVAWTNGHRDDGTCAESGRALGLLPTIFLLTILFNNLILKFQDDCGQILTLKSV